MGVIWSNTMSRALKNFANISTGRMLVRKQAAPVAPPPRLGGTAAGSATIAYEARTRTKRWMKYKQHVPVRCICTYYVLCTTREGVPYNIEERPSCGCHESIRERYYALHLYDVHCTLYILVHSTSYIYTGWRQNKVAVFGEPPILRHTTLISTSLFPYFFAPSLSASPYI